VPVFTCRHEPFDEFLLLKIFDLFVIKLVAFERLTDVAKE